MTDYLRIYYILTNKQGLLLNFDEYGKHAEVKKFISGHHLEFYNVE
ncbi:hypothetical protein [Rickettsia tamurae]|nr:hypothetical protein [Rickettsia tamurae]